MVDVGTGSYHSFAMHKNEDVYAWGLNSFGETGIPKDESEEAADVHHPAIIESLRGKGRVICIEGGAHHTIAVTDKGECLVWGRIDAFQMGIKIDTLPQDDVVRDSQNHPRILTTPTPVPGIDAVQATAGPDHCLAITRDGKAYAWGFSATYQTGLGTDEDVEIAQQIDNTAVRGKKLVWAGAGGQFSVIAGIAKDEKPLTNGVNGHI
jgi:regulator of chromosome condensation